MCGEANDDYQSPCETFCADVCCPCYWLCGGLTYCIAGGIDFAAFFLKSVKPRKIKYEPEVELYEWRDQFSPQPFSEPRRRFEHTGL